MTDETKTPPRRLAALAARVPVLAQVAGLGSTVAGVYLTLGLGVALIVGGVLTTAVGTLREARWL